MIPDTRTRLESALTELQAALVSATRAVARGRTRHAKPSRLHPVPVACCRSLR
jgi:hypothetical protein